MIWEVSSVHAGPWGDETTFYCRARLKLTGVRWVVQLAVLGSRLYAASGPDVHVYDSKRGVRIHTISAIAGAAGSSVTALLATGPWLLAGCSTGLVRVVNVRNFMCEHSFDKHNSPITGADGFRAGSRRPRRALVCGCMRLSWPAVRRAAAAVQVPRRTPMKAS